MKVIITGGAGFIGSALIRLLMTETSVQVLNVDSLTYAGNLASLTSVADNSRYRFYHADIRDSVAMRRAFTDYQPDLVMHLAAESHVDRSIDGPEAFIDTNVMGTCTLLEAARRYWSGLPAARRDRFRFHHVSTDEVYGSLGSTGLFTETTPYMPSSPYSASKAASDHLVRAWGHTFGVPVVITNCSNNYGPCQFPEKLIPLMIIKGLEGNAMPVYGQGLNVRDWLHVEDHARALWRVATRGRSGETYHIGGVAERCNIDIVEAICDLLDERFPIGYSRRNLITFVEDRPGHDLRYAMDIQKIQTELGWSPLESFESGLAGTVDWYAANRNWWQSILDGSYKGERLGLKPSTA